MEDFMAKVVAYIIVILGLAAAAALEAAPPYIAWKRSGNGKRVLKVVLMEIFLTPVGGFIAAFLTKRTQKGNIKNGQI